MLDMGPYYLTALVNLFGGVQELTGVTTRSLETRTITSDPLCGGVSADNIMISFFTLTL